MQAHKSNTKSSKEVLLLPQNVSWEEIIKALKEEKVHQFLKTIDPATFKYILKESNHSKVVQSLLETLKKIDPQNANTEYAEKMLIAMREVVKVL